MTRWLHLWSSYGELAGGGRSGGRYAGSWSYIQGLPRNRGNEGTTDNVRYMLHSVYAVLGVCWTWCMLYFVYAVLGVCCTWCMLYLVYTVLGVYCTRCILYSVYTVLSISCTWCMLCSVYAALGVCCPQCQLMMMAWRDREGWLNSVFLWWW